MNFQMVPQREKNKLEQDKKTYKTINLILAGVFASIFLYSGFFAYSGLKHPIPSNYSLITGQNSISTGLSRSFSSIMKFQFAQARGYNPYGISIFVFFIIQLFLRIFFTLQLKHDYYTAKQLLIFDCIISSGWLVLNFKPFIYDIFQF
jgi:hypothetical protein